MSVTKATKQSDDEEIRMIQTDIFIEEDIFEIHNLLPEKSSKRHEQKQNLFNICITRNVQWKNFSFIFVFYIIMVQIFNAKNIGPKSQYR